MELNIDLAACYLLRLSRCEVSVLFFVQYAGFIPSMQCTNLADVLFRGVLQYQLSRDYEAVTR